MDYAPKIAEVQAHVNSYVVYETLVFAGPDGRLQAFACLHSSSPNADKGLHTVGSWRLQTWPMSLSQIERILDLSIGEYYELDGQCVMLAGRDGSAIPLLTLEQLSTLKCKNKELQAAREQALQERQRDYFLELQRIEADKNREASWHRFQHMLQRRRQRLNQYAVKVSKFPQLEEYSELLKSKELDQNVLEAIDSLRVHTSQLAAPALA